MIIFVLVIEKPFIIQQNGPYKTKYFNDILIKTRHIDECFLKLSKK